MSGRVDSRTGIIVNIKEIDQIVRLQVLQRLDHKLLNGPNGVLADRPCTGELLLAVIRDSLECSLPAGVKLEKLRLEITPLEVIEWISGTGEESTFRMKPVGAALATHIYEFSASHRLQSDSLSEEENRDLFGKCNYPNGHGHNYVLEVTVEGPVDPTTGRVIDPNALDEIVNREVVDRYDHRHLNLDITEFAGCIPSSEVITIKIWERLAKQIPLPARLRRLLLRETARNFLSTVERKYKA